MANFALCLVAYFFSPIYTFIVPSSLVWPAYWLTIGLTCLMAWIDHWNSDHTAKNLRIMKASGISQLEIWGSAAATVLGFQLPGMYLLMNFFEDSYDGNNWTRLNLEEHLTMVNILTATAMVASTDLTFSIVIDGCTLRSLGRIFYTTPASTPPCPLTCSFIPSIWPPSLRRPSYSSLPYANCNPWEAAVPGCFPSVWR